MMDTSKVDYAGRRVNENGDEIVFEGIRDHKNWICCNWWVLVCLLLSCGFALLVIACFYVDLRNWRLYITHSELHYGFGSQYTITPFSDFNLISVVPGTNTVLVGTKHSRRLVNSNSGLLAANELRISYVANCKEFVAAVKAEMVRSQQPPSYTK